MISQGKTFGKPLVVTALVVIYAPKQGASRKPLLRGNFKCFWYKSQNPLEAGFLQGG